MIIIVCQKEGNIRWIDCPPLKLTLACQKLNPGFHFTVLGYHKSASEEEVSFEQFMDWVGDKERFLRELNLFLSGVDG